MRLYQAFPQPSPVTLGGRRYLALPLRLKHLAALETWLASRIQDPAEAYRERIAAATDEEERRLLAAQAFLRAEDWPPKPDSREAEQHMLTPLGLQLFLGFTIEPCNVLCPEDMVHIIEHITPDEYRTLCRVAYGLSTLDELALLIQPPDPSPPNSRSWGEMIFDICDGKPDGLIAVGDLFITQVSLLRSQGKAGDGAPPQTDKTRRRQRREMFAEAAKRNRAEDEAKGSD